MPVSGSYYYPVVQKPQSSVDGGSLRLVDGVPAPNPVPGKAVLYVDEADGDLKIVFPDGTVKTIATDT
jgi:hypothetical protein